MTAHGCLATLIAAVVLGAAGWSVPPAVDPQRLLGWLGILLAVSCGITWQLGV